MKNITKTLVKILFMFLLTIFTACKGRKKEKRNKNLNQRTYNKTKNDNDQRKETGIKKIEEPNKEKKIQEKIIETNEGKIFEKYTYDGELYEWKIILNVEGSKKTAKYNIFFLDLFEKDKDRKGYNDFYEKFKKFLKTKDINLATTLLYKIINEIPVSKSNNENLKNDPINGWDVFEKYLLERGANPNPDIFEKTLDFQFIYMDHTIRKFTILLAYGFAPDLKKDSPFFKKLTSRFNEISDDIYGYNDNFTEKYNKVFLKNYSQEQSFLYLYIPEPDKTILEITSNATSPGDGVAVYHILQKTPPPKENAQIITNLIIKDFFKTLCYELLCQKQRKPLAKSFYDYIVENEILDDAKIIEKLKERIQSYARIDI